MKLTANSIREKIMAQEAERVAEERRAAEIRLLEQQRAKKVEKFFNEVSEKALSSALEGRFKVEVGVDCGEEMRSISHKLDEYFLEADEIDRNDYLETHLRDYLDTLSPEQLVLKKSLLFESTKILRNLAEEMSRDGDDSQSQMFSVVNSYLTLYMKENDLAGQILAIHNALTQLEYIVEDFSQNKYSKIFNEVKSALRASFEGTWLFENIYGDSIVYFIKWQILEDDDVFTFEPTDDYLNPLGLSWIASTHGQLFVSALEGLVEDKMKYGHLSLIMRLYKFSSGYRIEMENKSEVYTLLDEVGLTRLFTKLGYKVKCLETVDEDEVDIEISWAQ